MKKSLILLCLLTTGFFPVSAQRLEGYADLVEKVRPAVVQIQSRVEQSRSRPFNPFFYQQQPRRRGGGSGTGFLISENGLVVTNRHVVNDADRLTVTLHDGREMEAELVGKDDGMDIALLKIEARNLQPLTLGTSHNLRLGDTVLALGYPLHLGFSVTSGIVSGIGRNMNVGQFDLATYIQTDADITFGNSGGPLVNNAGEVIGINTMIVSQGETYGFAIPSDLVRHSIDQLRRHGEVRRGALGVTLASLDAEAREYYGVPGGALIQTVAPGFPAEKAGIQKDDVILAVGKQDVLNHRDLMAAIGQHPPGAKVNLKVLSRGRTQEKTVVLGDRRSLTDPNFRNRATEPTEPVQEEPANLLESLGMSVRPLSEQARTELALERNVAGVLIDEVDEDSLAFNKNIVPGTILTHIDRKQVENPKDAEQILKRIGSGKLVPVRVLQVNRGVGNGDVSHVERTVFLRKR
ncbi:trypsin-like peptidase domain-containing protein [Acanthopleuribacter pedis]|uniref:Trypsin-like peptidase domain-containing protein n=1 Tax=Acanthopleuribacter pedis TaxID=442870 RepID=A0A8J7Q7D5_9BACT|nr:trypsin-like peptidase domain-containing protein [Acanthopleuribacter pedis]MBO1319681.1 trypsin-like peptidase domain-containing protein [Acanthopleuribacter pedis]